MVIVLPDFNCNFRYFYVSLKNYMKILSGMKLSEKQKKLVFDDLNHLFEKGYEVSIDMIKLNDKELKYLIQNDPYSLQEEIDLKNKHVIYPGNFYIKHIYPEIEFQATIFF
jgi:Zn/Cd-binding protein ZinT